jgi:AmpE protein
MSLLSLLIALATDRFSTTKFWRFTFYYHFYHQFFSRNFTAQPGKVASAVFVVLPVALTFLVFKFVDNSLIEWIISTFILTVCIGCDETRGIFKQFLHSAFRGDQASTDNIYQQLIATKNLPSVGFGQALIWLNYRYYVAIMLFFIVFGAVGVLFYRLLTAVVEHNYIYFQSDSRQDNIDSHQDNINNNHINTVYLNEDDTLSIAHESNQTPNLAEGCQNYHDVLFWLDWLPVRLCAFGYMFVGHFSKALPMWLENLFDISKPAHQLLIDVAQQSEDTIVNDEDITSQPCLLVSLAKRNVLLFCALIATLTLVGVVN